MDRHLPINLRMLKEIFPTELAYIREHRFDFMKAYPEYLILLNENRLSHWHVYNIAERMKEEEEAKKKEKAKEINGANLTGSHRDTNK